MVVFFNAFAGEHFPARTMYLKTKSRKDFKNKQNLEVDDVLTFFKFLF